MEKYAPGLHAGKFQSFIISKWGIEANSEKIWALDQHAKPVNYPGGLEPKVG